MKREFVCSVCGDIGIPKKVTKGKFIVEIILWIAFFPAGIIYTLWRLMNKYEACPKCNSKVMIPLDTPAGQKMANETRRNS